MKVDQVIKDSKSFYTDLYSHGEGGSFGSDFSWLENLRKSSILRFERKGFPSQSQEEWRFFPVSMVTGSPFQSPSKILLDSITLDKCSPFFLTSPSDSRLVFINGNFVPAFSSISTFPEGVSCQPFSSSIKDPQLLERVITFFPEDKLTPFADLNNAFFEDGTFLYIPKSTLMETPLHIFYFSLPESEVRTVTYPRTILYLERNSQIKVVENYVDLGGGESLTNSFTQIRVGEDSRLEHCRIQRSGEKAHSVSTIQVLQERNSSSVFHSISLSGKLVRNNIDVTLEGEGAECNLNGLYIAGHNEWVDNHTVIHHANSHTFSREFYKGILEGKSRAVFNGRIIVEKGAQKTDALQSNKNLLLSNEALVYTKPELEIFANDVKCKHGATIGQLDHTVLFYLRSRGIPLVEAKRILIYAFASEMIDKITMPSLKEALTQLLFLKMMEE